jgi:hypothetical protein
MNTDFTEANGHGKIQGPGSKRQRNLKLQNHKLQTWLGIAWLAGGSWRSWLLPLRFVRFGRSLLGWMLRFFAVVFGLLILQKNCSKMNCRIIRAERLVN